MQPNISSVGSKPLPSLNANPSASKSCTSIGPTFPFTMTSQPSPLKGDQLTLFAVDSPAKTSAQQANRPASMKAQGRVFFTNSCESFAWFSQDSSSWKTSQRSLLTDWTPFLGSWPRQGLMRNGHVFQQVLWEPAISATDGGSLLGTPRAVLGRSSRIDCPSHLQAANDPNSKRAGFLEIQIAKTLPTPMARDYKGGQGKGFLERGYGENLSDALIQTGKGIYLTPSFVEEMMGYPIGWTELKP